MAQADDPNVSERFAAGVECRRVLATESKEQPE